MNVDRAAVKAELERLKQDGVVKPVDVVEAARDEDSPLHAWFEWDDSEAAERYRLDQARQLIRVFVITSDAPDAPPVRAFVALRGDRKSGGGYRAMADVLSDAELHAKMLDEALADLKAVQAKFARIRELEPVFDALRQVEATHRPTKSTGLQRAASG